MEKQAQPTALEPQVAGGLHPDNGTKPRPGCPLEGGRGALRGCRHRVTSGRGEEARELAGGRMPPSWSRWLQGSHTPGRTPKGSAGSASSLEDGRRSCDF